MTEKARLHVSEHGGDYGRIGMVDGEWVGVIYSGRGNRDDDGAVYDLYGGRYSEVVGKDKWMDWYRALAALIYRTKTVAVVTWNNEAVGIYKVLHIKSEYPLRLIIEQGPPLKQLWSNVFYDAPIPPADIALPKVG